MLMLDPFLPPPLLINNVKGQSAFADHPCTYTSTDFPIITKRWPKLVVIFNCRTDPRHIHNCCMIWVLQKNITECFAAVTVAEMLAVAQDMPALIVKEAKVRKIWPSSFK